MANLRCSAAEESEDTLNSFTSLTGYATNFLTFGELNDSSVPFSFMIPSTNQDVDDVTLGEMLTAAHRRQVEYCVPGGMSVSQSSSSVRFDGSGRPDGERNVDQSVGFGVTRNTYSAHSKFSENTQTEKMVDGPGKPDERDSSSAQIRTLLEEQRQMTIAEYREKVDHHELQAAHQKKSADSHKDNYGDRNWNFVKLINKVLQKWKNYGNSRVLPSIRSRDENLSRTRTLFLELSGRVQELQNEVNCMNESKDFQDAESVRSGNSHVTSRPVSFPPHPDPGGMRSRSLGMPSRREGPPSIWDTHGKSGNVFCRSTCIFISFLSSRIESMEFVNRGAAPFIHSGEK